MKYVVYIPITGYYLDRLMRFQQNFNEMCIWHRSKEEIEKIVKIDSRKHNYNYRIIEVKKKC